MNAPVLEARGLRLAYDKRTIIDGLDLSIQTGTFTTLLGANGSGKSTLLKAFGRILTPSAGDVLLDGESIRKIHNRDVAKRLAILPQNPVAPPGTSVFELVMRGRNPHQSWARPWSAEDAAIADAAIDATGLSDVADRDVLTLSGGQRQRAWIALVVAQQAPTLLMDEPTTFLDLNHQLEVLRLVRRLNRDRGNTVLLVLHDISLAARFSDRVVVLSKSGTVLADGTPTEVLTSELLHEAFDLRARVIEDPVTGTPLVIPEEDDEFSSTTK